MQKVIRVDRVAGSLAPPVRLPTGFVRFDAYLTRSGCLAYPRADGSVRIEYRPPEENAAEGMALTCEAAPLTVDHPSGGCVTVDTAATLAVGSVGRPVIDGERVRASILVTSARGIRAVSDGYQEISLGYACDLEEVPGQAPDGTRYDAVQRNIEINHVALVRAGRAGPTVRLRADSSGVDIGQPESLLGGAPMAKRNISGVEVEVPDTVGLHIDKLQAEVESLRAEADKAKVAADGALKARCDAAEAQVARLEKDLAEAPAKLAAAAKARAELAGVAKRAEVKCDGLNDAQVMAAVATKVTGVDCAGKPAEYTLGLYAAAVSQLGKVPARAPTAPIVAAHTDSTIDPLEEARLEFAAAAANFHLRNQE